MPVPRMPSAAMLATPLRAPKRERYAERWIRTVRAECLDWLLTVGRRHLEQVLGIYVEDCNPHRPHRALQLQSPDAPSLWPRAARVSKAGCVDASCSTVSSMSTAELHEHTAHPTGAPAPPDR
jgi:Integrase core domain